MNRRRVFSSVLHVFFWRPILEPEKFHHESLLLIHPSSITYFIDHKDRERFISFCDYLYGTFYDRLSGMVLADDARR
jgi:hypothetical protein